MTEENNKPFAVVDGVETGNLIPEFNYLEDPNAPKTEATISDVNLETKTLTLEDVQNLDLSKPNELPDEIKNMKMYIPPHGVKKPLWKVLMSGVFNIQKPKVSKSWFNGKLLSKEEYAAIPAEETFAYRNKITKAKK